LRRHGLTASELEQSEQADALKDLGSGDGWYRPTELNRLSDQEAWIIGARMVSRLRMKIAIGPDQTQLLVTAITEACPGTLPNASATCATDRRDRSPQRFLRPRGHCLNNASFAVLADAVALGHRPLLGEE